MCYSSVSISCTDLRRVPARLSQQQTKPVNHVVDEATVGNSSSYLRIREKGHAHLELKATHVFYTRAETGILNLPRDRKITRILGEHLV